MADRPARAGELIPRRLAFRARGKADKGLWPEIEGLRRGSGWVRLAGGNSLPMRRFATVSRAGPFAAMRLRLRCLRANGCPRGDAHVRVKNVRFVLEDPTPPSVPRATGQLAQQRVQRGIQVLGSEQSDAESGIAGVSVWVNGAQVSTLPGSCMSAGRAASGRISRGLWRPCANTASGTPIQTNDATGPWREGFNQLRLCAADFAGNSRCSQPRAMRVDNVCPIRPQGDTAQTPAALRLTFADGSRAKTVRHPRTPRLRASLLSATGTQLPTGSPSICVGETLRLPNTPQIRTLTPTIPAGGALGVRPRASRFFYANYWLDEQRVLTSRVGLRMRARPRFAISPKRARVGRKVRFIARLHGPGAAGRQVTLQVKQGRRWRLFRTGRTNRNGVLRRTYRFRTVIGNVRFTFRAVAPRQRGYPYARGASKPRSIVVRARSCTVTPLADRQWKGDPVRSNGAGSAEPLMTAGDVASLLGVTRGWVYQQSRLGRIPTVTLGRYRRYRREAIEAWLVEMEVGSLARRDGYAAGSGGPRGPQVA